MANWVLFETTESVIEILWDIALAYFIIRLGFIYFFFVFTSSVFVSLLASSSVVRLTTLHLAEGWLVPVLALLTTIWARWLIRWFEIPRVMGFRLAIGAVGLLLMLVAEGVVALVLYEEGFGASMLEAARDPEACVGFGGVLALFALMPWVQMLFETKWDEYQQTHHGHEKKSLADAVPTVNKTEKKETKKTQ